MLCRLSNIIGTRNITKYGNCTTTFEVNRQVYHHLKDIRSFCEYAQAEQDLAGSASKIVFFTDLSLLCFVVRAIILILLCEFQTNVFKPGSDIANYLVCENQNFLNILFHDGHSDTICQITNRDRFGKLHVKLYHALLSTGEDRGLILVEPCRLFNIFFFGSIIRNVAQQYHLQEYYDDTHQIFENP